MSIFLGKRLSSIDLQFYTYRTSNTAIFWVKEQFKNRFSRNFAHPVRDKGRIDEWMGRETIRAATQKAVSIFFFHPNAIFNSAIPLSMVGIEGVRLCCT